MNQTNLTAQLVDRVLQLKDCPLSDEDYHYAKRAILDYCGVVLAGAAAAAGKTGTIIRTLSPAGGTVSVFGMQTKTDMLTAALVNGVNAHMIELDDGHRFGMMHLASPVISALFSFAENKGYSGEKLLRAVICGYDVSIALARTMMPGHKLKGFHCTGTCCTIGAACGIALLTDQSAEQIRGTVSAAATSAAGLLEMIEDASDLKPYNPGRAAMAAVAAAAAGLAGFSGPDDPIGGKRGFYRTMATDEDYRKVQDLKLFSDGQYRIREIYNKPYAACRHCHPSIEGALKIRKRLLDENTVISADSIRSIRVGTYKLAIGGHEHAAFRNVASAKMSTPYGLSAALLTGESGVNAYMPELLADENIQQLMQKVELYLSEELDALAPEKRAAIIEVTLENGAEYRERVDYPLGEPENPMTDAQLEAKFAELAASAGKTESEISRIICAVKDYPEHADELFELLR